MVNWKFKQAGWLANGPVLVFVFLLVFVSFCEQPGACSSASSPCAVAEVASAGDPIVLSQLSADLPKEKLPAGSAPSGSIPAVEKVDFEPSSPVTGDKLRAVVQFNDPADVRPKLYYRWKINGLSVQESYKLDLNASFKRGDFIEVEVIPTDVFTSGRGHKHSILVGNAPPELRLAEQHMDDHGAYQARLEAKDPEGDSVSFSLKSGPQGMTLDPISGTILWNSERGQDSDFVIQVGAKDELGAETLLDFRLETRWQKKDGE